MRTHQMLATTKRHSDIPLLTLAPKVSQVHELRNDDTAEVLTFLSARPVHTVVMASFIHDNGVESALNRGKFFGYRNAGGELEGVALIGHSTLVEARTEEALQALAFVARSSTTPIKLIMSSGTAAHSFWNHLVGFQRSPEMACTELLFEVGFPFPVPACEFEVRLARPEELLTVAEAHAEVCEIERGSNPMERDRHGFLDRVMRRIEKERVFVVYDGDRLVFKADIIAETDTVAYLEGVYVAPEYRGRGVGSKCLARVCLELLSRVPNVCLLSNIEFKAAHRSFLKAGMRTTDACTTLFV